MQIQPRQYTGISKYKLPHGGSVEREDGSGDKSLVLTNVKT